MRWFRRALVQALNGDIDFNSDTLKLTLHTSTYALNADTHDFVDDLTNELATGGGYTNGGLTIAGASVTYTAANSWATTRANSTAYAVDDVVRPATGNGKLYRCITAGTSGGSIPTFDTDLGSTTTDGSVEWENVGSGVIVLDMTGDPTWTSPTTFGPARYAVLSDRTPVGASAQPLIGYTDFGTDRSGGGGDFVLALHPQLGLLHIFTP
jgi:hypothetical protein